MATLTVSLEVSRSLRKWSWVQVAAGSSFFRRSSPRGARESVARSRPAEPGASRYPASARIDSSFACLESWHRAPLLAEEEARQVRGQRVSTHSSSRCPPKRMQSVTLKSQGQNLGMGSCHGIFERKYRRVSETRRVGSLVVVRTPGGSWRAQRTRSPQSPLRRGVPSNQYEGRAVTSGSEPGMTDIVRHNAPEVSGRALPLHSMGGRGLSGLWLAPKANHAARTTYAEATRVKNEGASPCTDARTYRVEEGSDDATFCHPPVPRVPGRWWARSVERHRVAVFLTARAKRQPETRKRFSDLFRVFFRSAERM